MVIDSLVLGREKRSTAGNRMRALLDKAHSLEAEEGFEELEDDKDFQGFEEQDVFEEDFGSTDEDEEQTGEDGVDEVAERELRRQERAATKASRATVNPTRPADYASTGILKQQGYNLNSPEFSYLKKFGRKRERSGSSLRREVKVVEPVGDAVLDDGALKETMSREDFSGISEPTSMRADQANGEDRANRPNKKRRVSFHPGDISTRLTLAGREEEDPAKEDGIDARSDSHPSEPAEESESDDERRGETNADGTQMAASGRRLVWNFREGDVGRKSSMRASTRANKEEVDMRVEEERRKNSVFVSRYVPRNTSHLTQADYISLALETEEQNRESLKDWLEKEEERKKLSRLERKIVAGPRISWISRRVAVEEVGGDILDVRPSDTVVPSKVDKGKGRQETNPERALSEASEPIRERRSDYTRNYVILAQIPGGQRNELKALFGDQGEWTNMPHIPTKSRPQSRRPIICPLTGLLAKYRHPATGIPYANAACYHIIDDIVRHRYTWSPQRHAYLADTQQSAAANGMVADGVEGWDEACLGWWEGDKVQEYADPGEEEADPEVAME